MGGSAENCVYRSLGQAIVFYAQREGAGKINVNGFRALPGKGVSGTINADEIIGGKSSFIEEHSGKLSEEISSHIERLSQEGKTVIVFTKNNSTIGLIALEDTIRKDAAHALRKIYNYGLKTVMLTGDSIRVAESVGKNWA